MRLTIILRVHTGSYTGRAYLVARRVVESSLLAMSEMKSLFSWTDIIVCSHFHTRESHNCNTYCSNSTYVSVISLVYQ